MGMQLGGHYPDEHEDSGYRPMAEINITPFVDVMLVLLIIFMVAAPLLIQGVPVDLPSTTAAKLAQTRKPMVVTLAADGSLHVRDEQIIKAGFVQRLRQIRASEGDTVVYVRADRRAAYGDVMEVLGRVGESGYARVSLLSNPAPRASASAPPPNATASSPAPGSAPVGN